MIDRADVTPYPDPARDPNVARAKEAAFRKQRLDAARVRRGSRGTYAQLRSGIRARTAHLNSRLDEGQLVASYCANRNAVRRALQMLAADGLVDRRTRMGTSVTSQITEFPALAVLPSGHEGGVGSLSVAQLEQAVTPIPAPVAHRMNTDASHALRFDQLGLLDGSPIYLRTGYVPTTSADSDFFDQIEATDSELPVMEVAFRRLFGVPLGWADATVESQGADPYLAEVLQIEVDSPILLREMVVFCREGIAREMSFTYFRGDHISLSYSTRDD